jgi:diguanylate cyclase (GGDEF)-like protein
MRHLHLRWPEKARSALASFRVRLILVVLLAVLPGLAFILYSAAEQRRQAVERAKVSAAGLMQLAAADHESLIEETRQLLEVLARVPAVVGNDLAACSAFLTVLAEEHAPRNTSFGVVDRRGVLACASVRGAGPANVADRTFFRQALRTREFVVGEYVIGRVTGQALLIMAYPARNEAGDVQKLVTAALSLDWLNRFAARAELPPGGTLTLLDHNGTILVRQPEPEKWVGRSYPNTPLFRTMVQTGSGIVEATGVDDVPRLFEFAQLVSSPVDGKLYLVIGLAKAELFAESNRVLKRNLLVLGGLTILALLAAWMGSNLFFLRRVNALMSATQRLEDGDLSARTGLPPGQGELDRLAQTFDRTAASLEERTGALERLNRVYALLSGIEGVLLRHPERGELLEAACHIAVEQGKFRLAVIHEVDSSDGLRVACQAGLPAEEATQVHATVEGEAADAHNLVGVVRREGGDRVVNELGLGPIPFEGSANLWAHGFGSAAAFSLRVGDQVVGVLSLYSAEPQFFDDDEVRLLREVAADISLGLEYIEKERRLQYLANYDVLTDLPNRALFEDRLTQAITLAKQDRRSVGVVSMGVVSMDEIIGTLGHATGDRVLQSMARALKAAIREGDTVARLSNDEFGIAFVGLSDVMEVETLARQLIEQLPGIITLDDKEVPVSPRLGAAVYPHDGLEAQTLVKNAALARQSAAGRVLAFFSAELDTAARRRQEIERELRHAIERAELELHYQPVVELRSRKLVGVEALLRWQSATLGSLQPSEFIPIAEEMGLSTPLGEWILETACRQSQSWRRNGLSHVRINVNISVIQLREPTFVKRVADILQATDFDPRLLALGMEITESALMENVETAVATLRRIKEMGVAVYVDDFGTGYSSLAYLRKLPIDWVKIDKSFVHDLPSDPDAVSVARAVVALGHSLGLEVVAEGVETEEQLASLREIGCDAVQGYLFSQPISAEEIEKRYSASRRVA